MPCCEHRPRKPALASPESGWCATAYQRFYQRVINRYGLIDAILARIQVPNKRPGHKLLERYMWDLQALYRQGEPVPPNIFSAAIADGRAPPWMIENYAAVKRIEKRIFNRHYFFENLGLAVSSGDKIFP